MPPTQASPCQTCPFCNWHSSPDISQRVRRTNWFGHYLFGWHRLRGKSFLPFNVRSAVLRFFLFLLFLGGEGVVKVPSPTPPLASEDRHLRCLYQHCGNNAVYFGKGAWFSSLIANVLCWDISTPSPLSFTTPDVAKIGFLSPNGPADGFIPVLHWDIEPHCLISNAEKEVTVCCERAQRVFSGTARVSCLIKSCQSHNFPPRGDRMGVVQSSRFQFIHCFFFTII